MKSLASKLGKWIGIGGLFVGSFFVTKETNAQSVPLNGPTPWEVIGNTYSQPNITQQIGLDSLEWYGSGDVNLDGKIDSNDLQAMNSGVSNNMADIDGDGTPSTQNDKNVLSEYLTGAREYLPGHWNELKTPEERESWVSKMIAINDGLNGLPPGWVCRDFIRQMELDFYGCSNYLEGYNQGFWELGTNLDSVAKFNIPFDYFSTTNTSGVSHAVGGVLVGRRVTPDSISLNPLDFRDRYFIGYNNDERVYPGNFNMSPNHPVIMYKSAYMKNLVNGQFRFDVVGPYIEWDLNNGNATLTNYWPFDPETGAGLLLENPNVIEVEVEDLENIVLNGGAVLPNQTALTPEIIETLGYNGVPEVTTQNTTLPYELTYVDRDTVWAADSTSFSFDRDFRAWIYSGGITKSDTTSPNIKVENLIGPNTNVSVSGLDSIIVPSSQIPPGQSLTPEFLEGIGYNAIPDTSTNSNLPISLNYFDSDTTWSPDSTSKWFDRTFVGGIYSFGNTLSDTAKQNIRIDHLVSVGGLEEEIVKEFNLYQNYPNPFNPNTTIKYSIPEESKVNLKVYNLLGEEVKNLVENVEPSGYYEVKFDADGLPSGVYLYRMDAKSESSEKKYTKTGKMVLIK